MTDSLQKTISAIIVAAGRGARMNSSVRKQYIPLSGHPILGHTLLVFDACDLIDRIFLVIPEDDLEFCKQDIIAPLRLSKKIDLVSGGANRQISVYNGLLSVDDKDGIVVIHDGVRPFITPDQIASCILGAEPSGACIIGIPAHDTVKHVDRGRYIDKTLERDNIWFAQTPQVFRYDLIMNAHKIAKQDGFTATDDASLVERLGIQVKIVPGDRYNIKITSKEDVELSRALLQSRLDSASN